MIIVIIVISLIVIAIIGGLVFLVYELVSKRKSQDGTYKLLPKSDDDDDADDEFDYPTKANKQNGYKIWMSEEMEGTLLNNPLTIHC